MSASEKPDFILETMIKTTPEALWEALTNGELTRQYYMMDAVLSGTVAVGEPYVYTSHNNKPMVQGEFLVVDPFSHLRMTFNPVWSDEGKEAAPPSQNAYEIEEVGDACKLTITHFGITSATEGVKQGWTAIAGNLKALLEKENAAA